MRDMYIESRYITDDMILFCFVSMIHAPKNKNQIKNFQGGDNVSFS